MVLTSCWLFYRASAVKRSTTVAVQCRQVFCLRTSSAISLPSKINRSSKNKLCATACMWVGMISRRHGVSKAMQSWGKIIRLSRPKSRCQRLIIIVRGWKNRMRHAWKASLRPIPLIRATSIPATWSLSTGIQFLRNSSQDRPKWSWSTD